MERRVRRNAHARCGAGEKAAITSKPYLSLWRSNYEAVEVRYLVKPGDTFWDVTEFYREMDDRHPYLPQFQYDNLKYNPDIEARGGTIYPGDIIRIKYFRRK